MKYPQLVSPRAVNAISDWLVSRLEQLGVESPQIYTRLLLSLLQSSVQVNDPIEFSNLEAFFANRKGGHKRFHLPSDTETLKKLNAVQCLREIVSNEQETTTIEQLVDELCEKLKDIEKQTQNLSGEERFLIETHLDTGTLLQTQNSVQLQNPQQQATEGNCNNNTHQHHHHQARFHPQQHYHHHQHQHQHQHQQQPQHQQQDTQNSNNSDPKRQHVPSATSSSARTDPLKDLDNDPKKRYFRAFPALSKEMEDSFRIWRHNAKSLTWPIVGRSIVVDNINNSSASLSSSSASSITSSSNCGANNVLADKSVEKKLKVVVGGHRLDNKSNLDLNGVCACGGGSSGVQQQQQQQQHQGAVATSAKKKSKRRRNQALCKGKSIQNLRKLSAGTTSNSSISGNKYHQYAHQRNTSPAWDTDFKGCWEMGPDLIKEFLSRQNGKKRNRSDSFGMEQEEHNERVVVNAVSSKNTDENPLIKRYIDLSFCYEDDDDEINDRNDDTHQHQYSEEGVDYVDEDYDDNTLASVCELAMDNFNPKRLYQREGHSKKSLAFVSTDALEDSVDSDDLLDFQQFKAKFNSSLEALWKDADPNPHNIENSLRVTNNTESGISSAFYANTSLNALAPFKQDLWNFWSNYQQHNFDDMKSKLQTTLLDDKSAGSGASTDIANSSDYFLMSSNLNDFDKSVGSVRRTNEAGASLGAAHTPSINVFLRNSIWSTSDDCVDAIGSTSAATTAVDSNESFLFKVWHSNKKLSELGVGNTAKGEMISTLVADNDGVTGIDFSKTAGETSSTMANNQNLGANLQFLSPYQNLKWSEGINAGPPYSSLRTKANVTANHSEMQSANNNSNHSNNNNNSSSCLRTENNYSSFSSVASISGATWEAPAYGQNAQPDLKSWCASNPVSLTEMYGNDVCDSIVNQLPADEQEPVQTEMTMGPAVTLPNHCVQTSGFIVYSRIKHSGVVKSQAKPLQTPRLPKETFRGGEEENLLTSERTHFHPIENFVDGHTFDISNTLDAIEFERTSSGLLRYESEDYLEYTRNDIYMADEEVATHSTNLLKYGRKVNEDKVRKNAFIIKFRVKRSEEVSCQTDEQDFQLAANKMAELPPTTSAATPTFSPSLEVNNMFHNTFSLSRQANNEAIIAAVTKAVAAAAKAAAENHLNTGHLCWLPNTNTSASGASTSATHIRENNPLWRPDNSVCDEVDFCQRDSSIGEQQQKLSHNWSIQEIEKQCHQRRCLPQLQVQDQEINRQLQTKAVDLDRNEENSLDNTSLHTLWGMCAVCNSCDLDKSMPANRLLRDELQLEADEIMSDLRYMQDLYIGESNILSETNEERSVGQNETQTDDKSFDYFNKDFDISSTKDSWNMIDMRNITKSHHPHDPGQFSMLQKVNQLIEDLLKPENTAEKLQQENKEHNKIFMQTQTSSDVWNAQRDHAKRKSLWQLNEQKDNNSIWPNITSNEQLEENLSKKSETFTNPINLLKEVGGSLSKDTEYAHNLNWEHDNLAKLWQPNIPTAAHLEETLIKHNQQHEMANNILNGNLLKRQADSSLDFSRKLVEEKNLKNLQNTNALTPLTNTTGSLCYKRVQQFLNNSAAKMKLAANRKRRHSASQNFYQQQHLHYGNNNNNNSDGITNLNAYKLELNETLKAAEGTPHQPEVSAYNDIYSEEQPTKQTIITCKYWTAATNGTQSSLDSAAAAMMLLAAATNANNANDLITNASEADNYNQDVIFDENLYGNSTFSCLIDKNASILKHVTMMARPLTR